MTTVESSPRIINSERDQVYAFLSDIHNLERIAPPGKVKEFRISGESFSFSLEGVGEMNVRLSERIPPESLLFESEGRVPFNFSFRIKLYSPESSVTEMRLEGNAELNPFMETMLGGYLQSGIDKAAEELSHALSGYL